MDEPTDQALRLQGITRQQYDDLEQDAKKIIADRSRRLVDYEEMRKIADLMSHIAGQNEQNKALMKAALEGSRPDVEDEVAKIMREYLDSAVNTKITDYYKIKYGNKPFMAEATKTNQPEQPNTQTQQMQTTTPEPDTKTQAITPKIQDNKTSNIEDKIQEKIQDNKTSNIEEKIQENMQANKAVNLEDRIREKMSEAELGEDLRGKVAARLSQWEGKDEDQVMRTESDVIDKIIEIAKSSGQQSNVDRVMDSCENLIKADENIHYYLEALSDNNRHRILEDLKP